MWQKTVREHSGLSLHIRRKMGTAPDSLKEDEICSLPLERHRSSLAPLIVSGDSMENPRFWQQATLQKVLSQAYRQPWGKRSLNFVFCAALSVMTKMDASPPLDELLYECMIWHCGHVSSLQSTTCRSPPTQSILRNSHSLCSKEQKSTFYSLPIPWSLIYLHPSVLDQGMSLKGTFANYVLDWSRNSAAERFLLSQLENDS